MNLWSASKTLANNSALNRHEGTKHATVHFVGTVTRLMIENLKQRGKFKMNLLKKITMLTIRDYGHDNAVDEVISNIENIVALAEPKNEQQKTAIENAVVKLMEEYHFDGALREEIEENIYTRESMKEAELEKLKEIADEYSELAMRMQNELEANTRKLRGLQTQWL